MHATTANPLVVILLAFTLKVKPTFYRKYVFYILYN